MVTDVGGIKVRITADDSDFKRGMSSVSDRLKKVGAVALTATKAVAAVGAAAAAAGVGFAMFVKSGMDAIDSQAKLARQLDGTIGGLRGLQLAANDAGVSTSAINGAVARLNVALGEAQARGGNGAKALEMLGLRAQDLAGMDVDKRLATIADRVQDLGLNGAQTASVLRDLGIRQTEIVNLMRQGGDAIRNATQEITDYGLAIDGVDSATIEAANDAMSRIGLVIESVRNAAAVELAPIILEVAKRFNDAARAAGGWGSVVTEVVRGSIQWVAGLIDAWNRVKIVFKGVEVAVRAFGAVNTTIINFAAQAISKFIDFALSGVNKLIGAMNNIPGVKIGQIGMTQDSGIMQWMDENAQRSRDALATAASEFQELIAKPKSSEWVNEFFDSIEKRRQQIKDSIQEDGGFVPGIDTGSGSGSGNGSSEAAKLREQMEGKLQVLRESLMTERELEIEHHAQRMEELAKIRELELLTDDEYRALREEAEAQHLQRLTDMEQKAADERARIESDLARTMVSMRERAVGESINLLNMFAGKSKAAAIAAIALEKGVAIARVVMDTQAAMWKARATLGPGVGDAVAAKYAALGTASVGLIAAQGITQAASALSGGGASSIGSGAPAGGGGSANQPAVSQQTPQQMSGTLTVTGLSAGSIFTGESVRELADQLLEYQRGGGRIVWA